MATEWGTTAYTVHRSNQQLLNLSIFITFTQDAKLLDSLTSVTGSDTLDGFSLLLVYRRDGMVNLDTVNLICEWPDTAERFKRAINALTYNMLHAHAAPVVLYKKK